MDKTYEITRLSKRAYIILRQKAHSSGLADVYSVYGRTINLMVDGELLALQTADTPFSPITLLTDADKDSFYQTSKSVKRIKKVRISNEKIQFEDEMGEIRLTFSYANATVSDMKLAAENSAWETFLMTSDKEANLTNLKSAIWDVIQHSTTGGFDLLFNEPDVEPNSLVLSYAKRVIHNSAYLCNNHAWADAAKGLSSLVGVGTGLTPSGDDFLCGILAGLKLIEGNMADDGLADFRKQLVTEIENKLDKTLDISKAFLVCAIEDEYSDAVLGLMDAITNKDITKKALGDNTKHISDAFHAIGHSSGIDTLCGIYFVLENLVVTD